MNKIIIKGARVHNLKNINIEIPKSKLVVITGLSGSGKSSLAFDTIYAEGQRRYMESLSSYARQFLGTLNKPDVDSITGLSPTIAIEQRVGSVNPRSTVGTITEIYDYLRIIFARIGRPHCPVCAKKIFRQSQSQISKCVFEFSQSGKAYFLVAPVIKNQKGEHNNTFLQLNKENIRQVRVDGEILFTEESLSIHLDPSQKHNIDIIFPHKLVEQDDKNSVGVWVKKALDMGDGFMSILSEDGLEESFFSRYFACPNCDFIMPNIEPRSFSFNSPQGACPKCMGLGTTVEVDPKLVVPNDKLSLAEGAIRPWSRLFASQQGNIKMLETLAKKYKFNLKIPVKNLKEKFLKIILFGDAEYEGVIKNLENKYKKTDSEYIRKEVEKYMRVKQCSLCGGKRLKLEFLRVKVSGVSIDKLVSLSLDDLKKNILCLYKGKISEDVLFDEKLQEQDKKIVGQALNEVAERIDNIIRVGMGYLNIDRLAATLSGGELQRIRLSTQISSLLVDVVYILDEPSIGLHQRDNEKLIASLKKLRDLGNTIIVVEHDETMMRQADLVVDVGPGAGKYGGQIVAMGTAQEIIHQKKSLTGKYLSGEMEVPLPEKYRNGSGKNLVIKGAQANNLKNIDVKIPLGRFVAITGVSGSGKSTLMIDILARALSAYFYRSKVLPAKHNQIDGLVNIDKLINIDQSPIGRTPRSNPATYTGVFTYIRDLLASLPESKIKGFKSGHFSFNVRGGRCDACQGDGMVKISMQFLQDVYVACNECQGSRYSKEALEVYYRGKNISDILNMTVSEARNFFYDVKNIHEKLNTLYEVGLGYLHLGQSATTLSGGEAQRIKLAAELSHRATGRTLYVLDEPTTGLHFEDVNRLLNILNRLVDKGNTVLVIEHNLDVIKCADWVIDLGPEGGDGGGQIVAVGTPLEVSRVVESFTGNYLKKFFN